MTDILSIIKQDHDDLVKKAIEILKALGYSNIQTEYQIKIPINQIDDERKYLKVDVFGIKDGKTIAVECGNLNGSSKDKESYKRILITSLLFDNFLWLPYLTTKTLPDTENLMIITAKLGLEKEKLEDDIKILKNEYNKLSDTIKKCKENNSCENCSILQNNLKTGTKFELSVFGNILQLKKVI